MNDPGLPAYMQGLGLGSALTAGLLAVNQDAASLIAAGGIVLITISFVIEGAQRDAKQGGEST